MSQIKFTKMHGLGNDFMVVDGVTQKFHPTSELIRTLSDRHTGIGFDQLLIVESDNTADFFYRIFNADGSEAMQCGNGARCIAQFIHAQKLSTKDHITVATKSGLLELYLKSDHQVSVNMGIPQHEPSYTLETPMGVVPVQIVSLGNLHCVIEVPDIIDAPVDTLGAYISTHAQFPDGINVGFMQIDNANQLHLRVYERGVGETQSCGSGACAAVVTGCLHGLLRDKVDVILSGGSLSIAWEGIGTPVWMTGPAVTVFEGSILILP